MSSPDSFDESGGGEEVDSGEDYYGEGRDDESTHVSEISAVKPPSPREILGYEEGLFSPS